MSYYWLNRKEILLRAKERYSKEKAAGYYSQNKEAIKKKSRDRYKNLSEEEKDKIKECQRQKYQELIQYKKEALQNKWVLFLHSIRILKRHQNLTILDPVEKNPQIQTTNQCRLVNVDKKKVKLLRPYVLCLFK